MEKLIVRNFLNLKNVELELAKINIIIGRQAEGKSIIAKLVFFFRDFFVDYRLSALRPSQYKKVDFDKSIVGKFRKIFPAYSWLSQDFEIKYFYENTENETEIKLTNQKSSNNRHRIKLEYSYNLVKTRRNLVKLGESKRRKTKYEGDLNTKQDIDIDPTKIYNQLDALIHKNIFNNANYSSSIEQAVFIPAGRSFFANLEENIFSFLSSNISIDYFLQEFGSTYEFVKNIYIYQDKFNEKNSQKIKEIISEIIAGNYIRDEDQDWIQAQQNQNRRKIKVANASSGQQEALPMLIILSVLPFISISQIDEKIFLIEEPEAHLFPQSQKNIIDLISLVFNVTERKHRFFITTHSPYILTAFNNLIQASNTLKSIERREKTDNYHQHQKQQLFKIVPENQMLSIEEIKAYTLENGELKSILDQENKLIDTNIIDEVSNEVGEIFEKLLDLEFEH